MTVQMIFLAIYGGAAVWFGVVVFRTHSMVRSALALLFSQTAIGAMFLVMQAEFLGVLQIMMMATEMSVMAIFMVMFMMDPGGMGKMDMTHQKRLSLWAGGIGLLAALLLVLAGIATPWMIGFAGFYDRWQGLSFVPFSLPLAVPPLLWLFAHALTRGRWPPRGAWHLAPALVQAAAKVAQVWTGYLPALATALTASPPSSACTTTTMSSIAA